MASEELSSEIKNFVFDCVLIIKQEFKNILRTQIQPRKLPDKIDASYALKRGLYKLQPEQMVICCPQSPRVPDYDEFDVFLLYNLIRNLCQKIAPTTGWGIIPNASNEKIGDDIERLRHIRNRLYAILETSVHQTEASVESTTPPFEESLESAPHTTEEFLKSTPHSKPELISRWLELKEALQRTGKVLDTSVENEKKIKIIEERYHFIKGEVTPKEGEVTPKEGEVLGKERKDKIDENGEGSLGGFVKFNDGDKEEIGFITCAHNLYDLDEMEREQSSTEPLTVVQPSYFQEGSKECGKTVRSATPQSTKTNEDKVSVDATLVRLTERHPQQLLFADLLTARMTACGFSRSSFPRSISEAPLDLRKFKDRKSQKFMKYIKCGTTTGLTTGGLVYGSYSGLIRNSPDDQGGDDFDNQIQIRGDKEFSDDGDCGSFVFQVRGDELHCIGMLVGGIAGDCYAIVTPIVSILSELKASLFPLKR